MAVSHHQSRDALSLLTLLLWAQLAGLCTWIGLRGRRAGWEGGSWAAVVWAPPGMGREAEQGAGTSSSWPWSPLTAPREADVSSGQPSLGAEGVLSWPEEATP